MKKIIIISIILLSAVSASAEFKALCDVQYETQSGMSDEYTLEVIFSSGRELNEAIGVYKFSPFNSYAVIWFSQGNAAILQIDRPVFSLGDYFDAGDFKSLFNIYQSVPCTQQNQSNYGKSWEITAKRYYQWIDPRIKF